jgi:hypothetical protein
MGRSARGCVTRRLAKACRAVVAASLLGGGIWLGALAVATPPAFAAHEDCRVTAIDVTLHNKTGSSLPLSSTRPGLTNKWCKLPGNPVGPGSVTQFEIGDNFFKTEVNVAYVAPNNDTLALQASSGWDDLESPDARCHVVPNGHAPSPYRCSAKVRTESLDRGAPFGLSTRVTLVEWEIHGP